MGGLLTEQRPDPNQIVDQTSSRRSLVLDATSAAVVSVAATVRSVASAALREAATDTSVA
jgi:hypothetical protein